VTEPLGNIRVTLTRDNTKLAVFSFIVAAYILGKLIQATTSLTDKWVASKNRIEEHYDDAKDALFKEQLKKTG
jgi:hypothetical protein